MSKSIDTLIAKTEADRKPLGSLGYLSEIVNQDAELEYVPTGFYDLDVGLLKIGGLPRGRMVEISGLESSGKSTVGYRVIGNAQQQGLVCALFDAENACRDKGGVDWLKRQGVDVDRLIYCNSNIAEEVFNIAWDLVHGKDGVRVDVVMIDSIGGLIVRSQSLEAGRASGGKQGSKDVGDRAVGGAASIITNGVKNLVRPVTEHKTLFIGINQVRDVIGSRYAETTTPGGHAWHHHMDVRLRMTKTKLIKEEGAVVGNFVQAYSLKDKVTGSIFRRTGKDTPGDIAIYYDGRLVDEVDSLIPLAKELGVVVSKGSYLHFGEHKANGNKAFKELIRTAGLKDEIVRAVKAKGAGAEFFIIAEDAAEFREAMDQGLVSEDVSPFDEGPSNVEGLL